MRLEVAIIISSSLENVSRHTAGRLELSMGTDDVHVEYNVEVLFINTSVYTIAILVVNCLISPSFIAP
jgi:hypothetical protein